LKLYQRASNKIGVSNRAVQLIEGKNAVIYMSKHQPMSTSDANMAARPLNCSVDDDATNQTRIETKNLYYPVFEPEISLEGQSHP